jgi:hypothetical protein
LPRIKSAAFSPIISDTEFTRQKRIIEKEAEAPFDHSGTPPRALTEAGFTGSYRPRQPLSFLFSVVDGV